MSDSVQGIYGGLAWVKNDDLVLKFLDGTTKAADKGAIKATIENEKSIIAEGMTIISDHNLTKIFFDELSLVLFFFCYT